MINCTNKIARAKLFLLNSSVLPKFSRENNAVFSWSCIGKVLYVIVVSYSLYFRRSEFPTKLASCLFLALTDNNVYVCGLKKIQRKLSRYKANRVKTILRVSQSFALIQLIRRNSLWRIKF